MVAVRFLAFSVLLTALLAAEVVNELVVSKAEIELVVEKTKATTEYLVEITPFGVYFLSVTIVKHVFEKIFVIKLKAKDVREVFYKNALYFGKEMGLEHADKLAEEISDAAGKAFDHGISSLDYFRTVSDTLKRSLKKQGLLKEGNAKELINDYVNSLQAAADSEDSSDPGAPVHALAEGTANFLKSKGINSPNDIEFAGRAFANELKKQAGSEEDESQSSQPSLMDQSGPEIHIQPISGAHDDTDIADAHSAAPWMAGRMEMCYLLSFFLILKSKLM